jgi:glutathione-regulated potassium-efflux system ancillary protein KefC
MLADVALFLAAAIMAVPLFKRIGLGSVLGYLAAGAIIGPYGAGFISNVETTMHFAEFGVVLLLFMIGLELRPSRLWSLRGAVFGFGGAQVGVTTALLTACGLAFGVPWQVSLVAALGLSMSSTAFATQVLAERNELASPYGRAAFGVLLFQDLAAIPVLALVPALGEAEAAGAERSLTDSLVIVGTLIALGLAGRFLLRPALRYVALARSHELSIASALFVVVGVSWVMEHIGLSMALGAFIAGVLLADSEYRHELEANIEPFQGLLLGLFFMAVGMGANTGLLITKPLVVLGVAFGVVAVKVAVLFGLGRIAKLGTGPSTSLGIVLSQGGEFAFVIYAVAHETGVLSHAVSEVLVVAVTLSMALTPLLFIARDRLATRFKKAGATPREYDTIESENSPVIIAGFGRFGQIIGRTLRVKKIPFTALDASAEHVDFIRRFGNKIYYGDASRVDLLRAAKADEAKVFVLAIDDPVASMRTLKVVREHFPHLRVIARARNRQHAYDLLGEGVTTVIRETFAASLEAAHATLEELGLPSADARETVRRFAEYDEAMMLEQFENRNDEAKLTEQARKYTAMLEQLFEQDAK